MLFKTRQFDQQRGGEKSDELSAYGSDGHKSHCSSTSNKSTALLKSIQALGKSSKGPKMQILGTDGGKQAKYLRGGPFERGYTSTESQLAIDSKIADDLNKNKKVKSKLQSDEKQKKATGPFVEPFSIDQKISQKLGQPYNNYFQNFSPEAVHGQRASDYRLSKANNSKIGGAAKNSNQISLTNEQSETNKKQTKNVIHNIHILNDKFEPSHLKIQRGEVVQWSLKYGDTSKMNQDKSSLYHYSQRMHVISFDTLNEESNPLKNASDHFKVRFFDTGVFSYRCSIYTRMKGTIEVCDPVLKSCSPPMPVKQISFIEDVSNFLMQGNKNEETSRWKQMKSSRGQSQKGSSDRSFSSTNRRQEKSNSELSQRLIEVLDEEEDLRKSHQGDTDTPFIKQNFFKEIFESERGSMLKIHGTELSSESEDEDGNNDQEDDVTDEEDWFRQQRVNSKLTNILQTRLPLQPINESQSSKSRSMSSANSSIEELKAKGYKHFKARRVRKADEIIEQQEETAKSEDDQPFWQKDRSINDDEFKSPICFEKKTFQRFTEFSMMYSKNTNTGIKERNAKSCKSEFECQQTMMDENDQKDESPTFKNDEEVSQINGNKPRTMTEFKLPESVTNSLCDNQSESSKMENEALFNKINDKSVDTSKILLVDSNLSTKCSETTKKNLKSSITPVNKLQIGKKAAAAQQVDTDDQSELDEIAALQKQRQNQKKKQRKRNKKKEQQGQTQANVDKDKQQSVYTQFDEQICSKVCDQAHDEQAENGYLKFMSSLSQKLLETSIEDQFMQNNVIDFLQERYELKAKTSIAF